MRSLFKKTSLNQLRGGAILDDSVDQAEEIFHAPPFTTEVADSIQLIATRVRYHSDEASRILCQKESNAASQREYEALLPLFEKIGKPRRVLEIGPGFGRSAIFFSKKKLWDDGAELHLYDATGNQTKYKQKHYEHPPKWPDVSSFCGNLNLLRQVLDYNGVQNFQIFDAAQLPLTNLPGPYDFVYGFYSIGFHWSLEYYLDDVQPLLNETSVLVCTLNKHFRPFRRLSEFSTRVLECREIKKGSSPLQLLVLSKANLPEIGKSVGEVF
jgi:hypothetical protein